MYVCFYIFNIIYIYGHYLLVAIVIAFRLNFFSPQTACKTTQMPLPLNMILCTERLYASRYINIQKVYAA